VGGALRKSRPDAADLAVDDRERIRRRQVSRRLL
jgi:hypothetical protein